MADSPNSEAVLESKPSFLDIADKLNNAQSLLRTLELAAGSAQIAPDIRNPLSYQAFLACEILEEVEAMLDTWIEEARS